ncbi:uncharacterized protein MONBRDRAFT_23323 [Monosiga brevicollis MX1]|uniref:Major facilitator superfamily (MFS) profile domain-containing protein n=1 Tax=Monosiga brevicollis TaxID=81824 RepID=A9UT19_MONBE|nr:uncharacterized protein MONBRDRAFT_23323 [Monosiga brevicollis MX1]EDQ91419.1 predicted protein [Monosiga brevicollis MX1]|eukprot:XP_001743841.1 hypothetical protein [Monosiga brevicollis MX1]
MRFQQRTFSVCGGYHHTNSMAAPLEATQRAELLIKLGMTQKQRDQSCLCLCVIWFFAGVEYAIILPTLWLYLQDLGMAKHWYLGLVLSVFSIANVCASPIFGSIADRGYIKEVLILASFFMILGNLFYFVADDGLVVLEARFLTGFGAGAASVAFAYLARVTTLAERTKVIGTTVATRQLGLLIGPALNFGTEHLHARLSHLITITPLNIPGLLMTGFWLIAALVTVFMFKDIPPALASAEDEEEEASSDSKASLVLPRQAAGSEPSLVLDEPDETAPLISIQQSAPQLGRRAPPKSIWAEYTQLPVLAIFVISFLCIFNQLALETWVTPFTNKYFGWRETANSIMYMIIGFVAIMGFLIVRRMAHQGASDRALMLIGLILEAIGYSLHTQYTCTLLCQPLRPHGGFKRKRLSSAS